MSKVKKALLLFALAFILVVVSILSYSFYEYVFNNKDFTTTAWIVTIGLVNALLPSPKSIILK